MARAIFVEGLNQSGKSTIVYALYSHLGQIGYYPVLIKLPNYGTLVGDYILKRYLPNVKMRPDDLRKSIEAQMILFAANRIEVLTGLRRILHDLEGEGLSEKVFVVCDRSPLSSCFTYIDSLLYSDILNIDDIHNRDLWGMMRILRRISEAQQGEELFQLTEEDIPALEVLYTAAIERILHLDRYFLAEFDHIDTVILDIPVEDVMRVRELAEFTKSLDVQEEVAIQTIVRRLYLLAGQDPLLKDRMPVSVLDQMEGGERLMTSELVDRILNALSIKQEVLLKAYRGAAEPHFDGAVDFSMHPDLAGGFFSLMQHSRLAGVRRALDFDTIYKEGLSKGAEIE